MTLHTTLTAIALALATLPATAQTHPQSHTPAKSQPQPTGPTILIDTTLGRITCRLFTAESPLTSANFLALATGTADWTNHATETPTHNQPFYDGTAFNGISDGILAGDRLGGGKGVAGPPLPAEKNSLTYDRPGLLGMSAPSKAEAPTPANLTSRSVFFLLEHADLEYTKRGGTIFGLCDETSLPIITALSHTLLSTDNHPDAPLAINHIAVLKPDEPPPPLTPNLPSADITPQPLPTPIAALPATEPTGPTALIDTTLGPLTCKLFQAETPIATANFIALVNGTKDWNLPSTHAPMHHKRFYDGLSFRRVVPDFMIQNADVPGGLSGGDIGFHFDVETVPGLTFDRPGRLAYANAGPGTNSSQFFITEHPVHRLDGNYTIFGQCDDPSVKLVETIARLPRDEHNRPLTPVLIRHITITP